MQPLHFNLIGAGRLGKNLALSLSSAGHLLKAIFNKQVITANQACSTLNSGKAVAYLSDLPQADIIFITTPDDVIEEIVLELASKKIIKPGSIAVHCSGVLNSDILKPLQAQGCFIASLHPLKAFRADTLDKNSFNNCDCALEGDNQATQVLSMLFKPLGANLVTIMPDKKPLYHAAAVFASNYLVTLALQALHLFKEVGIKEQEAKPIIARLMHTSLANIQDAANLSTALTGPLARGDVNTIVKHLKAQKYLSTLPLYKALSVETLPLTSLSLLQKKLLAELLRE
ncbi:Rossmann-like and DUF2520 domain-containing protein [Legionella sp. D16C41]|uniref:Rossmann-like and DUF2520 domain-containing protein n=1 Tax=Legionella sp. D16C41 TaxID=3402688 RepID=UPI003AF47066